MLKRIRMPSLSRVSPGAKATLEIPIGPTYYKLKFTATAAAGLDVTDIEKIEVLFNGKAKMTFTNLQRLMDHNTFFARGADPVTGDTQIEFTIHFFRAEMFDIVYRRAPGIGTADLTSAHVELQLAAAAPADIDLKCEAVIDPIPQPIGVFVAISEYPFSSAVAGEVEIDKLFKGPYYAAIHLYKSDVSSVKVVGKTKAGNDETYIDHDKQSLEKDQKEASPKVRVPLTAKATHIDFLTDGDLANALYTGDLSDFRVKMVLDTAGAVDVVTETLDSVAVG